MGNSRSQGLVRLHVFQIFFLYLQADLLDQVCISSQNRAGYVEKQERLWPLLVPTPGLTYLLALMRLSAPNLSSSFSSHYLRLQYTFHTAQLCAFHCQIIARIKHLLVHYAKRAVYDQIQDFSCPDDLCGIFAQIFCSRCDISVKIPNVKKEMSCYRPVDWCFIHMLLVRIFNQN